MAQKGSACGECPMCEQLDYRLRLAKEYGDFQYWYCGCDKVGGEFFLAGYCGMPLSRKKSPSPTIPARPAVAIAAA